MGQGPRRAEMELQSVWVTVGKTLAAQDAQREPGPRLQHTQSRLRKTSAEEAEEELSERASVPEVVTVFAQRHQG